MIQGQWNALGRGGKKEQNEEGKRKKRQTDKPEETPGSNSKNSTRT